MLRFTRKPWSWLIWRPGFDFWLVVLAATVLLWRTRDPRMLLPFCPVALNTLGLFLATASQNTRFQFPLTFATGFLICLAFLPKTPLPTDTTPDEPV